MLDSTWSGPKTIKFGMEAEKEVNEDVKGPSILERELEKASMEIKNIKAIRIDEVSAEEL